MVQLLSSLIAALQLMLPLSIPSMLTQRMHSGQWLRLHVVAQDDSAEMQRIKLCVRDAVQTCYLENRTAPAASMLVQSEALLPLLAEAAESAARQEGFTGRVQVRLEQRVFDTRLLGTASIPAGEYPALMILLGDAAGRNWWGLIDPELSLLLSRLCSEPAEGPVIWDWSWKAFWAALLQLPLSLEGV